MKRYIAADLKASLGQKIILLSGPRQVGKTTLAKGMSRSFAYYNYDIRKDIQVFKNQEWDRSPPLVIFDELHKMKKWKLWLKGLYDDGAHKKQQILVTGSARLDIAKKMGDSLAGRFFSFQLFPLDLKELRGTRSVEENYQRLMRLSGFPEPFLNGTDKFYRLWRRSHTDLILRQDLLSLENLRDLEGIELLAELLAQRVGSTISINALAEDLDRDDKTIKKWLQVLENLYVVFKVAPKSKNIARAIKKASKYYFYDIASVEGDESAVFENLVALSLKKELAFLEDTDGLRSSLSFLRTKDFKEIDFLVERKDKTPLLIEVKLSEATPSRNFNLYDKYFPSATKIQLVKNLHREFSTKDDVKILYALRYLENLRLGVD